MKSTLTTTLLLILSFSLTAQTADSLKGSTQFDDGMALYREGDYQGAIIKFNAATKSFGEEYVAGHAKSLEWTGYAYLRLSDENRMIEFFKKAEPYARAALEKYNDYKPIINNQLMLSMMLEGLGDGQEALGYYDNLESLILESDPNPMYMSLIYQRRARIAQRNRNMNVIPEYIEKATVYAKESGNMRQLIEVIETGQVYFYELGNFDKAVELSDEVIRLATAEYGINNSNLARYYTERARLDFVRQELEMAMFWIDRGIEIGTSENGQFLNDYGYSYYIKANLLLNQRNYENAINYFDLAIEEFENQLLHLNLIVAALDGKLRCFSFLKDHDGIRSAMAELDQQTTRNEVKKVVLANALLAKGFGYSTLEEYESAASFLDEVISMVDPLDKGTSIPLYMAYYEYSKMELARGDIQKSLQLIEQAIDANTRKVNDETYFISPHSVAELLVHKAGILEQEGRKEEALSTLNEGFVRIQSDRALLVGSDFSVESIQQLRNPALDLCYQLFQETEDQKFIEMAFRIGELAKSQQLIQWTTESINSRTGALDSTLFQKRRELTNRIGTIERLLIEEDSTLIADQYTDSLFTMKRALYDVSVEIKNKHPEFYKITYEKMNADLSGTVRKLSEDEQLLSYFITENSAYLIALGSNNEFVKLNNDGLYEEIEDFRALLMDPSKDGLTDVSTKLKDRLLPVNTLQLNQKLTIITDGILAYLPFELLSDNDGKYLMENHDLTYVFSANSMAGAETKTSNINFIAFAPDFQNEVSTHSDVVRSELAQLPGALQEVKSITEIQEGEIFSDSLATETNFLKHTAKAGLIHLATHAIVDDVLPNQSKLAFSISGDTINDGYLHAHEIFNLDLNAQLVTLSACNTGFGKIKKGEGVMSLSRAFAYAGVPATVVSLWPASDKSTPELMRYFYQNLKEGQPKDVALNNARKQYLENAQGKARHPFYWGGFVVIGDNSPIESERNLLVWLVPVLILFVLIFTLYRRKSQAA